MSGSILEEEALVAEQGSVSMRRQSDCILTASLFQPL